MSSSNQLEMDKLFVLLESTEAGVVDEVKSLIDEQLSGSRGGESDAVWLFNALVDYYIASKSQRTLLILTGIRDSYADHLLQRLSERLSRVTSKEISIGDSTPVSAEEKDGDDRLDHLLLLSHLICNNPPWVKKIPGHSIMKKVLSLASGEENPATLMCATLILSLLLPLAPLEMTASIKDVFTCFARVARWLGSKPPHVPAILLVHLHASLASLFHRLYALYPCNFLEFLRRHFGPVAMTTMSPTDPNNVFNQQGVFNTVILPMLSSVRLHHLFITASSATELNPTRWRKKEAHDILVDITKVTLDPTESASQGLVSDYIDQHRQEAKNRPPIAFTKTSTTTVTTTETTSVCMCNYQNAFQTICDSNVPSSQASSHLSPPQFGMSAQPKTSLVDSALANEISCADLDWSPAVVCGLTTPPPASAGASHRNSICKDGAGNAASETGKPRKSAKEVEGSETSGKGLLRSEGKAAKGEEDKKKEVSQSKTGNIAIVKDQSASDAITGGDVSVANISRPVMTSSHSAPNMASMISVSDMDRIMSSLKDKGSDGDEDFVLELSDDELDQEVSDIVGIGGEGFDKTTDDLTGGDFDLDVQGVLKQLVDGDGGLQQSEDARPKEDASKFSVASSAESESVINFMKNINRIRFNSISSELRGSSASSHGTSARPRSCPQLKELDETLEAEADKSVRVESGDPPERCGHCGQGIGGTKTLVGGAGNAEATNIVVPKFMAKPSNPWDHIWPYVCLPQQHPVDVEGVEKREPGAMEILEESLRLGADLHAFDAFKKIPITSQDTINWTHFGGDPPPDEVKILKTRLHLVHNQMLFERQKRQLHAKRNRHLLGRVVKAMALEEKNNAMKDQLLLQEAEMSRLSESMIDAQLEAAAKTANLEKHLKKSCDENQELNSEKLKLEKAKRQLEKNAEASKAEAIAREALLDRMKQAHFEILEDSKAFEETAKKVPILQEQLNNANNELILHSELQLRYQQRLTQLESQSIEPVAEMEAKFQALRFDMTSLKSSRDQLTLWYDASKSRVVELEASLAAKEGACADLKAAQAALRDNRKEETEATERRYQTSLRINQRLECAILEIQAKTHTEPPLERQNGATAAAAAAAAAAPDSPEDAVGGGQGPAYLQDSEGSVRSGRSSPQRIQTLEPPDPIIQSASPGSESSNGSRHSGPPMEYTSKVLRTPPRWSSGDSVVEAKEESD